MERLYNPDLMPEEEIKETFVARQNVVDELVSLIKHQPDGAGVQHAVIIAPRGMGKTTVLLMVRFAIQDSNLAKKWQAVQFPEESYSIYDLADFWMEILRHLDKITGDAEFHQQIENLHIEYPNNDDLQEAALALIKDWRRKHKKRLVVLVDNFDMILEQINDERDNARLRDVLMNDGTMMLIGGATTFFHEARAYDQPLYNFFKIYDLPNLKFEQMQDLLRRRAALDKQENFEETLKANKSHLRVLEHFTGGNPRLVLMLYRVLTQSDISEVRLGLEKLLDEVTPYYKSKVESLPPQQRKILDHIARVSSQTNEGLTPTEIATATRMSPNQASAQLKRLVENGYVHAANIRGRSSYYTLSERLYAIWHQMRFGRNARERMGWLVSVLKALYDAEEMGRQSKLLETRFREHLVAGHIIKARDALEHHRYLAEAMDNILARANAMDKIICNYIELKDTESLKQDVLPTVELKDLSFDTLNKLHKIGCINKRAFDKANLLKSSSTEVTAKSELLNAIELGYKEDVLGHSVNALRYYEQAIEINSNISHIWFLRGAALYSLARYEEALVSFERGLSLNKDDAGAWASCGIVLKALGKLEEALEKYNKSLEIKADDALIWEGHGAVLVEMGKPEEALISIDRALKIKADFSHAWQVRAYIYFLKFEEKLRSDEFDSAIEDWRELVVSANKSRDEIFLENISTLLLEIAKAGYQEYAKQLISASNTEERYFPLVRAIDYLQTADKALLEKLSPEVRGVVEEIVTNLHETNSPTDKPKGKSRSRKPKSRSRPRTRKQLR